MNTNQTGENKYPNLDVPSEVGYMQTGEYHCHRGHGNFTSTEKHNKLCSACESDDPITSCTPSCGKYYKEDYNHISHTHCWDNKDLPCGIPLEKHTQCCLCDLKYYKGECKGERGFIRY